MKTSTLLLSIGFLLGCLPAAFAQPVTTSGDQSPAVVAKNFSATYGVRADAIEAILTLYETEGLSPGQRKSRTEILLKKYQQAPEKKKGSPMLSDDTKTQLGLSAAEANALDWDLFARKYYIGTTGYQSPGVYAPGGEVNIWYGVPPKVVRALAGVLEQNKVDVGELEKRLGEQVKKYEDLKAEFEAYGPSDPIVKQAEQLLEEGKLLEVERLLDSDYAASKKRQAYKGFLYGQTKGLLLKYDEAAVGYRDAVMLDPGNSRYLLLYAFNEEQLARYEEAIRYYHKALAIDTVVFKHQPEKAAVLYNNLGEVYRKKGQYDHAITFYEKSLALDSIAFGTEHWAVAIRLNNLGSAYKAKGEYDRAMAHFETALHIFMRLFGEEHAYVAIGYNNLGTVWQTKGEYDRAIACYEKSMPIFIQKFGEKHPYIATQYNNLGVVLEEKGEYDDAITYYEAALAILMQVFGDTHPYIALQYNNLGSAWQQDGEYDRAINFYEKAIMLDSLIIGMGHPALANGYYNLGSVWYDKGDLDRAIAFYEKALAIDSIVFGNYHPKLAVHFSNIGSAWRAKGEYGQAIVFFEKTLAIDSVAFGSNHLECAADFNVLGEIWQAKGEYARAIACFEKSLTIMLLIVDPEHPDCMTTAHNLSRAANYRGLQLFNEKKYAEALPYFQKALENAEAAEDWNFSLTCFNNIGSMQKHLGRYAEGLAALEKGVDRLREINQSTNVAADSPSFAQLPILHRRMRYHQAGCLAGLGRKKEADALYQQLLQEARETNDTRLLEDLKNDGVH